MTAPDESDEVKRVFVRIAEILVRSGRFEVQGFGTFDLVRRKPRRARNPRTGARIGVPAKTVVRFTPAAPLKKRAAAVTDEPRE